jgi:cytochrome c oxidase subunit II
VDGGYPDGGFIEGAMTKMLVFKRLAAVAVVIGALAIGALLLAGGETALAAYGQAVPWQMGFQDSATPIMDEITKFHDYLLYVITAISAFVLILLVIIIVRFNARANPTPSRVTHNTTL